VGPQGERAGHAQTAGDDGEDGEFHE
jgi:hypothetical protein